MSDVFKTLETNSIFKSEDFIPDYFEKQIFSYGNKWPGAALQLPL